MIGKLREKLRDMEYKVKRSKICVIGDSKSKRGESEREAIFKEIMAIHFPELRCNNQSIYQTRKKNEHLDTLQVKLRMP